MAGATGKPAGHPAVTIASMSKRLQRIARDLRGAATERARRARERANRNRSQGENLLARLHNEAADRQAKAAQVAERRRIDDVAAEGDQLAHEQ